MAPHPINDIIKVDPPAPRLRRISAYRLLWILAFSTFVLDQVSKLWIQARLPFGAFVPYDGIEVIPGFFNLAHVGNTGAAWSILSGRSVLLAAVAALTLVSIYIWRRALGLRARSIQMAFGLLCGGIIGNLTDRLFYGHVIDFLDFRFGSYIYPTFNVADCGICVGVAIYLWFSLRENKS